MNEDRSLIIVKLAGVVVLVIYGISLVNGWI